jgi:hypothetical protein
MADIPANSSEEVITMNKLVSLGAAAAVAVAVTAGATSPSFADHFHGGPHHGDPGAAVGAGILGGMLGFMAGAAVAGSSQGPVYVQPAPDWHWRAHVQACFRAYGQSYDPRSDTYVDYYGYERQCTR